MPAGELLKRPLRPGLRRFRSATARRRILPSFLVLGAQRAGTSTLFFHLRQHPEISGPRGAEKSVDWPKELHFFDEKFGKGVDWYRAFFPLEASRSLARRRGRDRIAGEATPNYLFHPQAPPRAAEVLPSARLIALLRDPVERAYSHYQLMHRTGRENLTFVDALAAEAERLAGERDAMQTVPDFRGPHHRHHAYVARGLYAEQLERWLDHFSREQLLVIRAEDFRDRPAEIFAQTLAFLGVQPWMPARFELRNAAVYTPIDRALGAELAERFAESNRRLARLLGRDLGWDDVTVAAPR